MKQSFYADTNVIVRLLTNADEDQTAALIDLFENDKISLVIPDSVIIEACWVLKKTYKFDNKDISMALLMLLDHSDVIAEEPLIKLALEVFAIKNVDIVDAYLSVKSNDKKISILTWDKHFGKLDCEFYRPDQVK